MSGGYLGNIYNSSASGNNYMKDESDELLLSSEGKKKENFIDTGMAFLIGVGVVMGIFVIIIVIMVIRYFRMSDENLVKMAKANKPIVYKHSHSHHGKHGKHGMKIKLRL